MDSIEFKIALLDCLSYPIDRYKLHVRKPVTEESVRLALETIIVDITREMSKIEKEEDAIAKQTTRS